MTPAVVGCVFAAHSCLDMTTRKGRAEYTVAHRQLELAARTTGAKMPVNKPAFEGDIDVLLRGLDRAVINMIHANRPKEFQVVRGAFRQGAELSPGSGFHSNSHIQLALLDLDCVVGWFLPRGAILLSSAPLRGRAAGYESTSQFNWEFKRLFGLTPGREVKRMREAFSVPATPGGSGFVSSH